MCEYESALRQYKKYVLKKKKKGLKFFFNEL